MNNFYIRTGKLAAVLLMTLTAYIASAAQATRQLHLATGLRTPNDDYGVASSVFRVDESRGSLVKLADLVDAKQGSNFIVADHQRRLFVVGSPQVQPTELVVLNMDNPGQPKRIPIALDTLIEEFIFTRPGGKTTLALRAVNKEIQERLIGVDLLPETSTKSYELPWTDYQFVRREGGWSPGDDPGGYFELRPKDGKTFTNRSRTLLDMQLELPRSLEAEAAEAAEAAQTFLLAVHNDDIVVVDRGKDRGKGGKETGRIRLSVLDKKANGWHEVTFDGGGSSIRAFGTWIAINQADVKVDLSKGTVVRTRDEKQSPGQSFRQGRLNPASGDKSESTVDDVFQSSPMYFPGNMHLYDTRAKKKYTITTGQGDSEILLVDGSTVYYRVNDILYRAQIGRNAIENAVQILQDDNIPLAHWAFLD